MLSEERLRQAAHHAAQALEDSLPPPSQCQYEVSPEFRRNMKKLCRQAKRRPYRKVWKAVACAALVLILGSTSYLGLNAQAREAFFGWVTQITQNVSHYFFSGSSDKHPENYRYVLPEIPEGYTQDAVKKIFPRCLVDGFAFDFETILWAGKLGIGIVEMPVSVQRHSSSKVHVMRDAFKMLADLHRMKKRIASEKV